MAPTDSKRGAVYADLERTVEVLRLDAGQWSAVRTHRGEEIVRAVPFTAVEIDLLPLWGESRA